MSTGRRTAILVALAAVALAVLLRLPFFDAPLTADEGGYAEAARLWERGATLYRDVWVDRPQGLLLVFRGVLELGSSTDVIRGVAAAVGALSVLATMLLAFRLTGRRTVAFASGPADGDRRRVAVPRVVHARGRAARLVGGDPLAARLHCLPALALARVARRRRARIRLRGDAQAVGLRRGPRDRRLRGVDGAAARARPARTVRGRCRHPRPRGVAERVLPAQLVVRGRRLPRLGRLARHRLRCPPARPARGLAARGGKGPRPAPPAGRVRLARIAAAR